MKDKFTNIGSISGQERQSVHFTVVVVIPFGISPEFEDKFTACGVDLWDDFVL